MDKQKLEQTVTTLIAKNRGILAADESTGTIAKRFSSINVENTSANRQAYRDMLFRSKSIGKYISGVILYDETLRQKAVGGRTLLRDILTKSDVLLGIKVDAGAKPLANFPNETITEGLDGLEDRLNEYAELGASFAKWRAVINIESGVPTSYAIRSNMEALARYASLCQKAGIVPIVEPEVLMDGNHSIDRCQEVTEAVLAELYKALFDARVYLEGTVLKPNMVISGMKAQNRASRQEVADRTVKVLKRHVPSAVSGIFFLSGGQSEVESTEHLHLMNASHNLPWALSFSYGRALQATALRTWGGQLDNVKAAQDAFIHRATMNSLACSGKWSSEKEKNA